MADYTLAVGTHDPRGFSAASEVDALRYAVGLVEASYADDLRRVPQTVVTLMGPVCLVTRPSERADEFVQRIAGDHPGIDATTIQPGDTNTPDCNGD